jgi:hypothetical protein
MASPCGLSASKPLIAGSTLSPPMPISGRTRSNDTLDAVVTQRVDPRPGVRVVAVDQRAVDIEQDAAHALGYRRLHCLTSVPGGARFPSSSMRRDVEIERAKQRTAGVSDFVSIPALDEHQRPRSKRESFAVHERCPGSGHHIEPLIGTAMPVGRTALRSAGLDHHLGGLRPPIPQRNAKPSSKPKPLPIHNRSAPPARLCRSKRGDRHGLPMPRGVGSAAPGTGRAAGSPGKG